jgi:hypothetical protein
MGLRSVRGQDISSVNAAPDLAQLDVEQLRELVLSMHKTVVSRDREIAFKQALIDKMTHEMAVLKRLTVSYTHLRAHETM